MADDYLDGGYGLVGNISKFLILNDFMNDEQSKEYREKLKKEDSETYEQYLNFEKGINEQS